MQDNALLHRVAEGDQDALLAFYDAFSPRVFGLALLVTNDRDTAGQVTYETFRWLTRRDGGGPRDLPEVLAHAHQLAVEHRRAARTAAGSQAGDPEGSDHVAADVGVTQWTGSRTIQALRSSEQTVLRLIYLEGHTVREAAKQLSMSEVTVRSTLTGAMRSLASATTQTGGQQ
jgi:RNA polymerase sigma-70 factor (ECF subfamily)